MNPEVEKLIKEKVYQLRRKGFEDIEVLNRNTFKARKYRENYKLKVADDFYFHMNGVAYGYLK